MIMECSINQTRFWSDLLLSQIIILLYFRKKYILYNQVKG